MESRFQTSFIPKKPIETGPSTSMQKRPAGLFRVIAVFIFLISLAIWGGIFLWQIYLNNKIDSATQSLQASQKEFDLSTVTTLTRLNNRLTSAGALISNHLAVSRLFAQLESMTLKSVRYSDFSLAYAGTDKGLVLTLKGQAASYGAVAKQSDFFSQDRDFHSPIFSDLNLDTTGKIIFTVTTSLDPTSIFYNISGDNSTSTPNNTTNSTSTPATTNSPFQ